jgi:hypothetical protein
MGGGGQGLLIGRRIIFQVVEVARLMRLTFGPAAVGVLVGGRAALVSTLTLLLISFQSTRAAGPSLG